jgi:hypothetical protein
MIGAELRGPAHPTVTWKGLALPFVPDGTNCSRARLTPQTAPGSLQWKKRLLLPLRRALRPRTVFDAGGDDLIHLRQKRIIVGQPSPRRPEPLLNWLFVGRNEPGHRTASPHDQNCLSPEGHPRQQLRKLFPGFGDVDPFFAWSVHESMLIKMIIRVKKVMTRSRAMRTVGTNVTADAAKFVNAFRATRSMR